MIPFPMQMQTIGTGQNPMAMALRKYRPPQMVPQPQMQSYGMLVKPMGSAVGNSGPDSQQQETMIGGESYNPRVLQARNQMMGSLLRRR